ncbi:MAG TPA: metal-dependent hydrolase [Anaerolineales bacterium]|nr:metal-dependent hydrolase [Anaerolineales bacterium]
MAQAGIHGLVSVAVRKWAPGRTWLVLGMVLGSLLPDADNLAVAVATVTKQSTAGLHRTFTHSLFTIIVVGLIFYLVSRLTKQPRWNNLGLGLGLGILLHVLLDLLIWFDGVAILWPLSSWVNLWGGVTLPDWWTRLMMPLELLFLALFLFSLYTMARQQGADSKYLGAMRVWIGLQGLLFLIFLVLAYTLSKGFLTIFGAVYLLSLGLAVGVTIRMRSTIERQVQPAS